MNDTTARIPASPLDASPAPTKTKPAPVAHADDTRISSVLPPVLGHSEDRLETIHVSKIKIVSNVRITPLDKKSIETLAATIRTEGQLEPAQVRMLDDGTFALTFGHRRHAAVSLNEAKHGGDGMLRCVVRSNVKADDIPFIQLVENCQREDMTTYDTSVAIADLQARYKLTAKAVAQRIGLSDRQTRSYIAAGQAPEWIRSALNGVDIKVKVKGEDGTPKMNADGTHVTETRSLPGLSLDHVCALAAKFTELQDAERVYLPAPGYKPRAERAVRHLIQQAAAHGLTKAELDDRISKQALSNGRDLPPDAEATVIKKPAKRPYTCTPELIHIKASKVAGLTSAERRAMAAELHAALLALGPDFFTSVEIKCS